VCDLAPAARNLVDIGGLGVELNNVTARCCPSVDVLLAMLHASAPAGSNSVRSCDDNDAPLHLPMPGAAPVSHLSRPGVILPP